MFYQCMVDICMFRKKLREMLKMMGMTDIDDELLDNLQRQLFQFLEYDDSLASGISFKSGSILTSLQVQNYQEVRDQLQKSYQSGDPPGRLNLRFSMSSLCLYLKEDNKCQVTDILCPFQKGTNWWECEIVRASCQSDTEEWK
jgi:hypothetical protein